MWFDLDTLFFTTVFTSAGRRALVDADLAAAS
jgi:hypothetical protein